MVVPATAGRNEAKVECNRNHRQIHATSHHLPSSLILSKNSHCGKSSAHSEIDTRVVPWQPVSL